MLISDVIETLEKLKAKHGDLPVYYWDEWHTVLVERAQFAPSKTFDWDSSGREERPDRIVLDDGEVYTV